jgi:hypothetical protein
MKIIIYTILGPSAGIELAVQAIAVYFSQLLPVRSKLYTNFRLKIPSTFCYIARDTQNLGSKIFACNK